MSIKSNRPDDDDDDEEYGTSHYLDQLNQVYSKHQRSSTMSWEDMDDDVKYELVVKALFVIANMEDPSSEQIKESLRLVFERDAHFAESAYRFMLEKDLLTTADGGTIQLTKSAKEILD